jgi:predicted nucleic acid-binding protein
MSSPSPRVNVRSGARLNLFLDSSALFAGIVSADGASRALLLLAEDHLIDITVSEQVIAETEGALARKVPRALLTFREALRSTGLRIVRKPSIRDVDAHRDIIDHEADVPIVVAAMQARVDYLVTLNRRHFIDDPKVAIHSGLRVAMPGDALAWVRERLTQG